MNPQKKRVFHVGNAHRMDDISNVLGYLQSYWNGVYYETPLSLSGLVNARTSMPWHESAMEVKRQILATTVTITKPAVMRMTDVENLIDDYLWAGNFYALLERSLIGDKVLKVSHCPALYTRRMKHPEDYCWLKDQVVDQEFARGSVVHVARYDPRQEVYGMPSYLSALNHAFLNKSNTVFRRKYIDQGGHMGFILYLNSPEMEDSTIEAIEDALYETSGDIGNLVIHDPSGDGGDIKLLKIAEISNQDDFFNLQNITRDAVLAIHRVPPQVMSIMPANVGGFGNPVDAAKVFARNEIQPLQVKLHAINEAVGFELLRFDPYRIDV